jgi:peptidylprolyl isomerase
VRKLLLAVTLTVALAGCVGSSGGGQLSSSNDAGGSQEPNATQGPVVPSSGTGGCQSLAPSHDKIAGTTDLKKKPQIEVPDTPPPCNLVVGDIVIGSGAAAKPGDHLTMKYVGVTYATGKQFDASWDRNEDFDFILGAGKVIQGWDQGLVGMQVGGRRQLIIPPQLGYGDQGAGADIPPGATLIFVVDLVKIG